jgi:hypothetical protein
MYLHILLYKFRCFCSKCKHLDHKVLSYVEYRAVSCVFQNIDPPRPSPPSECVLPPHQRRGVLHTRRAVRGVNILEDASHRIGLLQPYLSTIWTLQKSRSRSATLFKVIPYLSLNCSCLCSLRLDEAAEALRLGERRDRRVASNSVSRSGSRPPLPGGRPGRSRRSSSNSDLLIRNVKSGRFLTQNLVRLFL